MARGALHACPEVGCTFATRRSNNLLRHLKTHGPRKSDLKCHTCNEVFPNRHAVVRHQKVHAQRKTFVCPYEDCTRKYSRKDNLMSHVAKCHPNLPFATPPRGIVSMSLACALLLFIFVALVSGIDSALSGSS